MKDKSYQGAGTGQDVAAFLAFMELRGDRPVTIENYENDLARLPLMFPSLTLVEVTDAHLAQVFRTFPERGRRTRVAKFQSFYKWARQTRRVIENPMDYLPNPKRQPRKVWDLFSDAEVDALLDLPALDAAPLALLFDAGLRRDDLRNMTLRHTDPTGELVKVFDGKGGKDRVVPMVSRLRNRLTDLQILEGVDLDDYVLYGSVGNAQKRTLRRSQVVGEATFARWWRRCLDTAGVRYRHPHIARHTFATRWRRLGLDLDYLKEILGHESIRTTSDLYVQVDIADVARAMALLDPATF